MASWSTRELADLAGTTVNTIRHYHRLGLLDAPMRRANGYKSYDVHSLVQLLRIRRLAELGVPLSQVGEVGSGGDGMAEALQAIDAELATKIAQLQQARADIATILRGDASIDSPAGFLAVASKLSRNDSSLLHIYSRVYTPGAMRDLERMIADDIAAAEIGREIDELSADADDATRQRLADALVPILAKNFVEYPWLSAPADVSEQSPEVVEQTMVAALTELYNSAQLDVLARASVEAQKRAAIERSAAPERGAAPAQ